MMKTEKLFDMNRVNDAAEAMKVEMLAAFEDHFSKGWRSKCAAYSNGLTNVECWHALQHALTALQSHALNGLSNMNYDVEDDEPYPMTEAEVVDLKQRLQGR